MGGQKNNHEGKTNHTDKMSNTDERMEQFDTWASEFKDALKSALVSADKAIKQKNQLLTHIGANNIHNAKSNISAERRMFEAAKEQLKQVVDALEVDNWRNAVVRAKTLLDRIEKCQFPKWLLTISPEWIGKVPPSQYKTWLRFCKEQYLVALGQMEEEKELDPTYDIEEDLQELQEVYLNELPQVFVNKIAKYIRFVNNESEEDEE